MRYPETRPVLSYEPDQFTVALVRVADADERNGASGIVVSGGGVMKAFATDVAASTLPHPNVESLPAVPRSCALTAMMFSICHPRRAGFFASMSAATAEAIGEEAEVPLVVKIVPMFEMLFMFTPGAVKSTAGPVLEKLAS